MRELKLCPFCHATLKKLNPLIAEHPRNSDCVLSGFVVRIASSEHVRAWNTRADEAIRRETIEELLRNVITYDRVSKDWKARGNSEAMDGNQVRGVMLVLRKAVSALADQPSESNGGG